MFSLFGTNISLKWKSREKLEAKNSNRKILFAQIYWLSLNSPLNQRNFFGEDMNMILAARLGPNTGEARP